MIKIFQEDGDHFDYLLNVEKVLNTIIQISDSSTLYLIRINNWFGSKWLHFSGKTLGAVGVWKEKLTLPPFSPNRIDSELIIQVDSSKSESIYVTPEKSVHRKLPASTALCRHIADEYPGISFVWFSSNTIANGRGSIMVYSFTKIEGYWCWYTELSSQKDWEPSICKGITSSEYQTLFI